jgi:hypothetical protein
MFFGNIGYISPKNNSVLIGLGVQLFLPALSRVAGKEKRVAYPLQ